MIPIQVVGYKNSGKTTLVHQLVQLFTDQMTFRVATLKHHGHGGKPETVRQTDSHLFSEAGAVISGVEGEGMLQLSVRQPSWEIDKILAFYQVLEMDVLLIEGYKQLSFPKFVLIRDEEDLLLVDQLSNVKAIVTSLMINPIDYPYPILKREQVVEWVMEHLYLFEQ
ncbi:molybdopterin-guanine dinucleotide biosynthesis protein B [Aquibacillus sediminis]|uniref:molybdopterin-guanine dinucleotide biosynthesis protein B n=1 Tax=Aquibacillus sediminis TaxID=2574734 RepID=UPI0011083644|nr:molybdopterin-guanine dinucleotide biosynthesis protein B [Aquibacillus sediminis]